MPRLRMISISLAIFGILSVGAYADQMSQLINKTKDVCYERSYSPAHMKKHPDQTVTFIRFAHLPSLQSKEIRNSVQKPESDFQPMTDIEVRFKGDEKLYGNSLICFSDAGKTMCGVECDGGRFVFRFKNNKDMLIDFRKTGYMALESDCGEGNEADFRWLANKKDDKLFKLSSVDPRQCTPTIKARHDRWKAKQD